MLSRSAARSALGICLTGLALAGSLGMPRDAYANPPAAKAAKQPIGVGAIAGPQGPKVRAKVLKVLRDSGSYEVTDVEDVKPGASPETYQQMATGIQADAIVVGTVSKSMNLTLSVYGANGARVDAIQIKGGSLPKLSKAVDNELEIAVADPLERARPAGKPAAVAVPAAAAPAAAAKPKTPSDEEDEEPAATAAEKPAAKKTAEVEAVDLDESGAPASSSDTSSSSADTSSDADSGRGRTPLELDVGVRGYNRNFAYTGSPISPGLIPYSQPIAPTVWIAGRFYPGALAGDGPLSHIGIMFRYELGLATTTNYVAPGMNGTTTTTNLKTNAYEYQIGLRARLPLGRSELGIFGLYGNHSFVLEGDGDPTKTPYALVPDVHYHYIRVGLDARFYVSKLVVGATVAPRFLTSMKELDKGGVPGGAPLWFPGATGSGLDFGLMLGWQLLPWLTPAVGFDVVRYGFDFNNLPHKPEPRVIAGGATDTYVSGWLGVLMPFDFAGGGAAAAEAKPAESEATEKPEPEPEAKPKAAAKPAAKQPAKPAPKAEPTQAEPKPAAPAPAPKPKSKPKSGAPVEEEEEEE